MQWNVNQGRLTDRSFIQNWVRRTINNEKEPAETTKVEILGEGPKQTIIWVSSKKNSQIWIWNCGEKASRRHKLQLERMAMHPKLHRKESYALQKLAREIWEPDAVEQCLNVFHDIRNHVENDIILLGGARPAPSVRKMLRTAEAMIHETKKQAPNANSKLKSVLINLTGGWKWPAGGQVNINPLPQRFINVWMENRQELVLIPAVIRAPGWESLPQATFAEEEWHQRALEMAEAKKKALEKEEAGLQIKRGLEIAIIPDKRAFS